MKDKRYKNNENRKVKEYEVDMGEKGIFNKRNKLNDLTGKEWTKFTKSWFVFDAIPSDIKEEKEISRKGGLNSEEHPATYSPTMMADFISFFTKKGQVVLDPFCGIGSTLVGCDRTGRKGIGIELNKKYARISKMRTNQKVIIGNSTNIKEIWKKNKLPNVHFCISSPPYWDILQRSTGLFEKDRSKNSLDIKYSNKGEDVGNINNYDDFLKSVCKIYNDVYHIMEPESYMVIIVKNIKKKGKMYTLAWDIAKKLSKNFELKDEKIWCQDQVGLAPFGYPYAWTSNIVHHYCIILRKNSKKSENGK